ncbi:hypothetical protein VP01_1562g1 [Puccinia sorghi]|uniref:BZIP domain-containing protein n=1 Tax=Puccinia sorghi TaxID=27349 RepID=A0A0L6VIK3_9BASI|nr:hypothetical protein VP01_1562g1 [Puccinia sorghi]
MMLLFSLFFVFNRTIPPPLSLSKSSHQNIPADDLMTARGNQFTIDSTTNSCRFQPYLNLSNNSNTSDNWPSDPSRGGPIFNTSNFRNTLPDDASLSSNELRSSCSSLASTASSQSSGYFPPTNTNPNTKLPFEDLSSSPATTESLYPPLAPPGFSQAAAYPPYAGPTQRPSLSGLPYPPSAFNPNAGSPPVASASSAYFHFDSVGAGRRHTVSAYASPIPIELNLVGNPEIDETLIKEEKRRRVRLRSSSFLSSSIQRFRDRTRERQREKQERLEYLERRTKQLESQLRACNRSDSMHDAATTGSQSISRGRSAEEHDLIERLQSENKTLRSSLKAATEEVGRTPKTMLFSLRACPIQVIFFLLFKQINRLQQLSGNQSPHSPLSMGQVYANTLAQLSPPASTDFAPGSSQTSSPAAEPSYFGQTARGASPSSDSASGHHLQQRLHPAAPGSAPAFSSHSEQLHQLASFNHLSHHHHHPLDSSSSPNEFWDTLPPSRKVPGWQPIHHNNNNNDILQSAQK